MGMLITLEGGDGVGKDTVALALKELLEEYGEVVIVNDPSHDGIGGALRQVLLAGDRDYHPLAQLHMFVAARADNLHRVIIPLIHSGKTVICTRGPLSTMAYQLPAVVEATTRKGSLIHSGLISIKSTFELLKDANIDERKFLITCPDEVAYQRLGNRENMDNFENVPIEVFHKRSKAYRDTAPLWDYITVDNGGEVSATVSTIMQHLG